MTTTTMSLTDFLLARIAEDEAAAEACIHARGPYLAASNWLSFDPESGVLIDAHRLLAECEAKRQLVALHTSTHECPSVESNCGFWTPGDETWTEELGEHMLPECPTLRLLAVPYQAHDAFRDEWLPEDDETPPTHGG